jgi:hypothetical protein
MLVLLEDDCPVPVAVRPRDRLLARLHTFRLDHDLAAGASPDATVGLALRARRLVATPTRRELAWTARRVLTAAHAPGRRRAPVTICRERVRDCSEEIEDLIRRLLTPGPVSARGVAQVRTLLCDATSPIYYRASRDDLRATVLAAADALSPVRYP